MLKMHVLTDNTTIIDRYYLGEPGLSYFLEEEGKYYLFDTGYSDVFLKNAEKMHIDLLQTDAVILSHGHNDHTWGLVPLVQRYTEAAAEGQSFRRAMLIAHPDALLPKRMGKLPIGTMLSRQQLQTVFSVQTAMRPVWLSDKLVFLGAIPRANAFEGRRAIGETERNGEWTADFLYDDSALAYLSKRGIVLITGCSHAGICNIIAYAKQVCRTEQVHAVIGGFHLLCSAASILQQTVQYLSACHPDKIYPGHCVDLPAKVALSRVLPVQEPGVGTILEFL